jgi:hypothetical protein
MTHLIATVLAAVLSIKEVPTPSGPNAAEPFLFATHDGVLLSWLEPVPRTDRTALRFARYRNGKWNAPRTIIERNDLFVNWADFPSIVEDSRGALFVHWLQKSSTATYSYDVKMATSKDRGATWSAPFLLNRDGKQAEHGFVTLVPLRNGGVGATWLDGRNGDEMSIRYADVSAGGKLTEDRQLDGRTCECCTTGMTMLSSGPLIVYRDRSADEIRDISYVRRDAKGWSEPRVLRSDGWKIAGCPVNGPQIDSVGNRAAVAWFTAANEQQRVYASFFENGFSAPIVVDDGKPLGRVDVLMLDANRAVVSWLEQTTGGAEIRARLVTRDGKRGASRKIADSATARGAGFTRIARVGSDIWFAWTQQTAGGKRIRITSCTFDN